MTQRLSSAANPENGTVTYLYNADGTLQKKTDARGQRVEYSYDTNGRLAWVRRYLSNNTEDACQAVTYTYDTNPRDATFTQNGQGRVTVVEWGGVGRATGAFANWYSYSASGHITKKRLRQTHRVECCDGGYRDETFDLDDTASYDNEGRMATSGSNMPPGGTWPRVGGIRTYGYDSLGRPNRLTVPVTFLDWADQQYTVNIDVVKDVLYGPAGEMTQIRVANDVMVDSPTYSTETRQYNARLQMWRQTVSGVMDMEYRYSATQNNGRLTQSKDWITGEEVTYTYDSLQRLISAVTTGPEWGQSFTYDGFGNLLNQTVTKGSAPSMSLLVSGITNRITSAGFAYDGNGNLTAAPGMTMTYDVENRLATAGGEQYAYGPDSRRVWKRFANGTEELNFYGITGEKLTGAHSYEYFAGRLIRMDNQVVWRDRLGSVRANGSTRMSYFPYGGERTVTGNGTEKFGTYYRDATGLDYAEQRYYASNWGRFNRPDPYRASGGPSDPGSWNRYAYVQGDPVNWIDSLGLLQQKPTEKPTWCDIYPNDPICSPYPLPLPDPSHPTPHDEGFREDQETAKKEDADKRTRGDIVCDDAVIGAMKTAWAKSANGTSGAEAGFVLVGSADRYTIVALPYTNEPSRITFTLPDNTFALFHVHPNGKDPAPSDQDKNVADDKGLRMFTESSSGLWEYDAGGRSEQLAKGLNWTKPCSKK